MHLKEKETILGRITKKLKNEEAKFKSFFVLFMSVPTENEIPGLRVKSELQLEPTPTASAHDLPVNTESQPHLQPTPQLVATPDL